MPTKTSTNNRLIGLGVDIGNEAEPIISLAIPYTAKVEITGTVDILFHRWNCDAVAAKAKAPKGSAAKKTDDIATFVYRDENGNIGIPGNYLRGAIIGAAKFRQDPRSSRKSAQDLVKAAITILTPMASMGIKLWDYEHKCRVLIQRAAITRTRPAIKSGWKATFEVLVTLPEYISQPFLQELLLDAGRLIGLGDDRPTYGRFVVSRFKQLTN